MNVEDILCDGGLLSTVIPNYKQRDGQIKVANAIYDSYGEQKTVIVNAPTGNGKSIACLVPAILNKSFGKTIISTATKALQSQYENKDIPMLHQILNFTSHVLKGRDNYVCLNKYDENADAIPMNIRSKFQAWLDNTKSGDLETVDFIMPQLMRSKVNSTSDECLEGDCPHCKKCFYLKNKALAMSADVLVVNHDLLALFLILKDTKHVSMFGDVYSVIVDEAHKMEDIFSKYFGFTINVNSCNSFVKNVKWFCNKCMESHIMSEQSFERLNFDCEMLERNMTSMFSDFLQDEDMTYRLYHGNFNPDICKTQMDLIQSVCSRLPDVESLGVKIDRKVSKRYESIFNRSETLMKNFDMLYNIDKNILDYCYYVDTCDDIYRINLTVMPIDISEKMRDMLFTRKHYLEDGDIGCVSLLSATLFVNGSFSFIKNRLGIDKYYVDDDEVCLTELSVPEMFDYRHSCLLYIPKGIVEPGNKDGDKKVFTQQIVDTIYDLDEIVDGGILALFTSYSELSKVYDAIDGKVSRQVISQTSTSRQKGLSDFKDAEDAMFFGTKTFWEGVDVQGRACSCVVIDRIPFPVPSDPIIEARIDKIKREKGDWFNNFYLPIAIIALQQGFGRLIRTHKDLGMVVLMDVRILTKNYGWRILRSLPNCLRTRNWNKVEVFWDIVRRKRELRNGNGKKHE